MLIELFVSGRSRQSIAPPPPLSHESAVGSCVGRDVLQGQHTGRVCEGWRGVFGFGAFNYPYPLKVSFIVKNCASVCLGTGSSRS